MCRANGGSFLGAMYGGGRKNYGESDVQQCIRYYDATTIVCMRIFKERLEVDGVRDTKNKEMT